jgi:hypothetical protein
MVGQDLCKVTKDLADKPMKARMGDDGRRGVAQSFNKHLGIRVRRDPDEVYINMPLPLLLNRRHILFQP